MTFHILIQLLRDLWHPSTSSLDHKHMEEVIDMPNNSTVYVPLYGSCWDTPLRQLLEDVTVLSVCGRAYILIIALTTQVHLSTSILYRFLKGNDSSCHCPSSQGTGTYGFKILVKKKIL